MKTEYLKCEKALDKKGGNIELLTDIAELTSDICLGLINESLRRHYATKWRQGFNTIVSVVDLLSHKVSSLDKAAGIILASLTTEDLIFMTELTPMQRHEYMKLDALARIAYQEKFSIK